METIVLARIIHVVCVVFWIGGVAMVTTVMIPSLKVMDTNSEPFKLFHTFEKIFAKQARVTTLLTGLSGFYMLNAIDGWSHFYDPSFWWFYGMIIIWAIFSIMLFVIEPFILPRVVGKIPGLVAKRVFSLMYVMHIILLAASVLTIAGAVGGSHGWLLFRPHS